MDQSSNRYDVIVVGIGGMGSATTYHLARRGHRVLGLERFSIPHEMGSSHGLTRIIRLAYWEHPSYVPLLRRSYELWRELEANAGERLLHITGSLDIGGPGSAVFEGAIASCSAYDLRHEVLSAAEVGRRFPAFRLPSPMAAVLQPDGGFLDPERCVVAHARGAEAYGAEIHDGERVLEWEAVAGGVQVSSERASYVADRLVICAGAWASHLVPILRGFAVPERNVLAWFETRRPELFAMGRLPVFIFDTGDGVYYGFPIHGIPGLKLGRHHHLGEKVDPETVDRQANARDEEVLRACATRYLPDGAGPTLALKTCLYTNTPDTHFAVDLHPEYPQVAIAAGFSGHGFKFCSVIGEVMADLAETGTTRHDIEMFRLGRFR